MFAQEKQSMHSSRQRPVNGRTMISCELLDLLLSLAMYSWSLACNTSCYKKSHFPWSWGSPHVSALTFKPAQVLHFPLNQGKASMPLAAVSRRSVGLCSCNTLWNTEVTAVLCWFLVVNPTVLENSWKCLVLLICCSKKQGSHHACLFGELISRLLRAFPIIPVWIFAEPLRFLAYLEKKLP